MAYEHGGRLIWKIYPGGHELTREVLALAWTWFDDLLSNKDICSYGEDDTGRVVPAAAEKSIEVEFRNPLYSAESQELLCK